MGGGEKPRVFVTHPLVIRDGPVSQDPLDTVREIADCEVWPNVEPLAPASLEAAVRDCEGLLCMLTDRIDRRLLAAAPRLRVVSSCSVGVDHIDLEATGERGIAVGNTPGVLVETTADLTFALLLAAARRIPEADRFVRDGKWKPERPWSLDMMLGRDLHGATLGILGLGAIGQAVARRAAGFGMRVVGWTRSGRPVPGVLPASREAVIARADFLSLHVALTRETRHLIDRAAIDRMKEGAILVNTGRGGLVDEAAVAQALRSGKLAAAAFDVFDGEPLDRASPLLDLDNAILAPHIGSASIVTRRRMVDLAVANLIAGITGRPLPHAV